MPVKRTTPCICRLCGEAFMASTEQIRRGLGFYCSRRCNGLDTARRSGLPTDSIERFSLYIDRNGTIPSHRPEYGNCWPWTGPLDNKGYGVFSFDGTRDSAHQEAWRQACGAPAPDGLFVCHTCDFPRCVRNDGEGTYDVNGTLYPRWGHLWIGTVQANHDDMVAKDRAASGDRSFSRNYPERLARGERNGSKTKPQSRLRGEDHPKSSTNEWMVRSIRLRYASGGVTQRELAIEFGLTRGHVAQIVS